ncbi:hypothetical protein, partial [Roseisolibacter sp. H3M3-2]|uniref:hypothetical protein n=1 Tax=Roseisolibacter sp. H3M3-2 TaxID=3031323 RepID=UPI0023DC93D2
RGWTLLAAAAPLAGAWLVVGRAPRDDAAWRAHLVGQYAPLLDTLRVGGGTDADVRLPDRRAAPRAWYDPTSATFARRVDRGAAPVDADGAPVNALPLGRSAEIRVGGASGVSVASATPRWPLPCLVGMDRACGVRVWTVRDGARVRTVRVPLGARGVSVATLDPALARAPLTV